MSDDRTIIPSERVDGELRVPGDKSISHRVAMLSALGEGVSTVRGFLRAEDCLNTLRATEVLGASVTEDGDVLLVRGTGGLFYAPAACLDMGNSGTGLRLLVGLLAGHAFTSELTGDASLRTRPMDRIRVPLESMGARVELLGRNGRCAPLRVTGGRLAAIDYHPPVASAQVKGCVLLAGLLADGETRVTERLPTRDHSERVLSRIGVPVRRDGLTVCIRGSAGKPLRLPALEWRIPGDFSSAAFWIMAGCRRGCRVTVKGVGLNPRRTAFLDVLRRMGAGIELLDVEDGWEPCGTVRVHGGRLRGTTVGGAEIPNLIDELPLVAVAGAIAEGETIIRDAEELRVKESDRIAAMTRVLRTVGVEVEERPDGMVVRGGRPVTGGDVDSLGDHRIAMASAVLGLCARDAVTIRDVACVDTSYPSFWRDLDALAR